MLKIDLKKVDWVKVAKIGGYLCQGAAMVLGGYASSKSNERHLDELFAKKQQMESK